MSKGKGTKISHSVEDGTLNTKGVEPPKNKEPEISQNTSNNAPPNYLIDTLNKLGKIYNNYKI